MSDLNEQLRAAFVAIAPGYNIDTTLIGPAIEHDPERPFKYAHSNYLFEIFREGARRAPAAAPAPVAANSLMELRARIKEMQEAAYTFGEHSKEAACAALDGVLDEIDALAAVPAAAPIVQPVRDDLDEGRIDNALANFLAEHTRLNQDGIDTHAMRMALSLNYAALRPVSDADIEEWRAEGYLEAPPSVQAEPVAMVDEGDDGMFAEILPDRSVKVGQYLYAAPATSTADDKDAAQYQRPDQLNAALLRACEELPPGYNIVVEVENGAGWVEWRDPDNEVHVIDTEDCGLAENVERAIAEAFDHAAIATSADEVKS